MADNTLNVEIKAEVDGLTFGLKKAEKQINGFADTVDDAVNDVNRSSKSVNQAGKSFNNLGKNVKVNANPAVIEFSRVIQDAPFGIIGVANNIQQLTANFGDLSRQAGGSGKAFKAFLGAFTGTSGVLFVVSLVTTLLVSYGDELKSLFSKSAKAANAQKKLAKSIDDYADSLINGQKAQAEGARSAGKEITNLSLLKRQIEDTNLSQEKRIKAFDKLKERYPKYFQDLTEEQALTGGLKKNYNTLTSAILDSAKARAAQDLLAENFSKQLILQEKLNVLLKEEDKARETLAKNVERNRKQEERGRTFTETIKFAFDDGETDEELDLFISEKKVREAKRDINELKRQTISLRDAIKSVGGVDLLDFGSSSSSKSGGDSELSGFGKKLQSDIAKAGLQAQISISKFKTSLSDSKLIDGKALFDASETGQEIKNGFSNLNPTLVDGLTGLNEKITPLAQKLNNTIVSSIPDKSKIDEKVNAMTEALKSFNESASNIINSGLTSTFGQLGESIGQALATGGNVIQSAGASLLSSLGSILIQLGKLAIATGIGLKSIKLALASLNPVVAIAAGVGLVALGSAFSAKAKGISGSFGGGNSSSGAQDFSSSGSQSFGSSSNISTSTSGGGNFVFEIAGTKLIGVLKNTLDRNKSLGGQNSLGLA